MVKEISPPKTKPINNSTRATTTLTAQLTSRKEPEDVTIDNDSVSSSSSIQLDLVSFRICQVIVPVTLCSIYAVILIRILEWNLDRSVNFIGNSWDRLGLGVNQDSTFSKTLLNNTIIVGIFVLLIALVTIFILFVFYMGWHTCLSYYFYIPSFIIMAILTPVYFKEILSSLNWFGIDLITLAILTWNFVALGMIAIFNIYTGAPLLVQQFYLIHNSAILAVVIIRAMPTWASWILLIFLVFWDLFAVLAPYGPLNLIISLAEREGIIEMPGLVYATDNSTSSQKIVAEKEQEEHLSNQHQQHGSNHKSIVDGPTPGNLGAIKQSPTTREPELDRQQVAAEGKRRAEEKRNKGIQERGVNIGLGDFIFYSLLVGLNAKGRNMEDFYAVLASLDAILVGLVLTLVILAITRRALPALPISIALGLIVSVATTHFVPALSDRLAAEQIFI